MCYRATFPFAAGSLKNKIPKLDTFGLKVYFAEVAQASACDSAQDITD
jgi:hypothetical protein